MTQRLKRRFRRRFKEILNAAFKAGHVLRVYERIGLRFQLRPNEMDYLFLSCLGY